MSNVKSFLCPFCGCKMSRSLDTYRLRGSSFDYSEEHFHHGGTEPRILIHYFRCPEESCRKTTVIVEGINGYIDNHTVMVYPEAIFKQYPDYVPAQIRQDYEEAQKIVDRSPKAAATLARRCIQGMIRDFWGIQKSRLVDEIDELQSHVPATQWKAIDAVRRLGNIGAHMEKDVNLIVDIATEEASQLLRLVELLIEKWYVARHDEEELYYSLTELDLEKQNIRSTP